MCYIQPRFACGLAPRRLNYTLNILTSLEPLLSVSPPMKRRPAARTKTAQPAPPLDKLERTIAARAANPSEKSYTSQLLAGGVDAIGKKIVEEAAEVVEAAAEPGDKGREHFVREVGDLLYHLLVLLRHRECTLADVETELTRRFGVSGLEEKAARKK